jgi:hypothetical protein
MARPKSKGALRTFIFTVDANDPKYSGLVEYLENIDNGARSYVIRQILNSYLCEQMGMGETVSKVSIPQEVTVKTETIENKETSSVVNNTPTVQTKKSSFKSKMTSNNTQTKTEPKQSVEEDKEKTIVPSEGMSKLLNNFQ